MSLREMIPSPSETEPSLKKSYRFDIVSRSRLWFSISGAVFLVGVIGMIASIILYGSPLRLGLDFTGGTLLDLQFEKAVTTTEIRSALQEKNLGNSIIQVDPVTAKKVLIRTPNLSEKERSEIETLLQEKVGSFERLRIESVGPTVGGRLLRLGLISVVLSFGLIVLYLAFRFQWDYAVFAIVALLHDVVLTVGVFAVLGVTLGVEIDSLFLVALLTIVGFSVNDTVVIYDRIRENLRLISRQVGLGEIINLSLNQTFARSLNTSLTTMLPLVAIFLLGGETLKWFALALLVGFTFGVYSSIFIASPLLLWWRQRRPSRQANNSGSSPEKSEDLEASETS
jgi:preprotein translocase subunit SecF